MKQNYPVTGREHDYPQACNIISTTDLKGAIVHVNRDFVDISGFVPEELLHKNHNVIRHPDMPPAAFQDLWDNLKQGQSWMGIVKNRCKNGDHYWVDAYVTPMHVDGKLTGYQSVRVRPAREHVDRAERLYARLMAGKSLLSWRLLRPFASSMTVKLWGAMTGVLAPALLAAALVGATPPMLAAAAGAGLAAALGLATAVGRRWVRAAAAAREIFHNPVAQQVYTGSGDELGQLQLVIKEQQSRTHTILCRIDEATDNIHGMCADASEVADAACDAVEKQQIEIEQIATAMNEMSSTVQEVARNAADTAEATQEAAREVVTGKQVVEDTVITIESLAEDLMQIAGVIARLKQDSDAIGTIVHVIRDIAEQTNLLALNAAIEAARAGEQGRGFAVVAGEVRSLANRTQQSTSEIEAMIERLQGASEQAVSTMEQGRERVDSGVESAGLARQSFLNITRAVDRITDMSTQIATASEEQSAVAAEINRNVHMIHDLSSTTVGASERNRRVNGEILAVAGQLRSAIHQFAVS